MINIADLVSETLPGNFFVPEAYVQGDYETGLIESRQGSRLLALPILLIESLYVALEEEIGQASGLVLYNCGRRWGKNFYRRFGQEVSAYYNKPIAEMEMVEFIQCLKQCWKTYGWGTIDLDLTYYQQGFIVVKTQNSAFAEVAPPSNRPVCFVEAGILSAFLSQLTGRDLECVQTSCESLGDEYNHFVLGLSERVKSTQAWLDEAQDHETIMQRLCNASRV